jgi:cytochrome c peroxidase
MHPPTVASLALVALAAFTLPASAEVQFSDAEIKAILAHGPWPAPSATDPTNRVSGKQEAIEFGERLFFDQRLSPSGRFSCGSCHIPERNWTDNRTRGAAIAEVERNTPTLMNLRMARLFGWDGATDALWKQSVRPVLDRRELGSSPRHVAELVRTDGELSCRYRNTFGAAPSPTDDEAVLADVGRALAALVETFETPPTPFDRFRNALARGERITPWIYSEAASRGAKIFVGKGSCSSCHSGPNFSSGELRKNGFTQDGPFKVPTLRHLLLTAPYGHHGEVETLANAVRHYSETGSREIGPLKLTAAEQSDLVVFLESISTFNNPWRPGDPRRCF